MSVASTIKCLFGFHTHSYYRDIGLEQAKLMQAGSPAVLYCSEKRAVCDSCGKESKLSDDDCRSINELIVDMKMGLPDE